LKRAAFVAQHGIVEAYSFDDWEKLIPLVQPQNLVFIYSPDRAHYEQVLSFLNSGCTIVLEKPVVVTLAQGLVDETAFRQTLNIAQQRGALISYKATKDGPIPYELNCSYLSVVAPAELGRTADRARAFLSTQAILLAFRGLPAVYFHSWVGSEHWREGVETLGYNRAINRQKIPLTTLEAELQTPGSLRALVFQGFKDLLEFRKQEPAMASFCGQQVVQTDKGLIGLLRGPDEDGRRVLCLHNLSPEQQTFPSIEPHNYGMPSHLFSSVPLPNNWNAPILGWETRWIAFGGNKPVRFLQL
jgi:sucrose phosphorylase